MGANVLFLVLPLLCYVELVTGAPPAGLDQVPLDSKIKEGITLNVKEDWLSSRDLTSEQITNARFDTGNSSCFQVFEDFDCVDDQLIITGENARRFLSLYELGSVKACKKPKMDTVCAVKLSQEYTLGFSTTGNLESFNVTGGECKQLPWTMSMDFIMVVDTLDDGKCLYLFSSTDCTQPKIQLNSQFLGINGFAPQDVQSVQICDCSEESQDVVEADTGLSSGSAGGHLETVTNTNDNYNLSSTETDNENDTVIPGAQGNPKRR